MKTIHFSRGFIPAAVFSCLLAAGGAASYVALGGFNLGVDFQAGFIQEVQFAPPAFTLTYDGKGDATARLGRGSFDIVVSGANVESATYSFGFAEYPDLQRLAAALPEALDGLAVELKAPPSVRSEYLVQSAQGKSELGREPFVTHYLEPDAAPIEIGAVRAALSSINIASTQILGNPSERRFLIRIDEEEQSPDVPAQEPQAGEVAEGPPPQTEVAQAEGATQIEGAQTEEVAQTAAARSGSQAATLDETVSRLLQQSFGEDSVAITRSDFVGSRFSKQLASQAGLILFFTLFLILIYASIRFRPQFATGAVIALLHDALVMVAFITWTRMEFNTTTIAAILTALGYSINDTIVVFDRIRENRTLYPERSFAETLDCSITETLSRTIITTVTTLLAVLALYVFTTRAVYQEGLLFADKMRFILSEHNSMKDFALAMFVGISSGVYSTMFTACGWTLFWEKKLKPLRKNRPVAHKASEGA